MTQGAIDRKGYYVYWTLHPYECKLNQTFLKLKMSFNLINRFYFKSNGMEYRRKINFYTAYIHTRYIQSHTFVKNARSLYVMMVQSDHKSDTFIFNGQVIAHHLAILVINNCYG